MPKLKIDSPAGISEPAVVALVSDVGASNIGRDSRLNPLSVLPIAQKKMLPRVAKATNIAIHSSRSSGLEGDGGFGGMFVIAILFYIATALD